MCIIRMLILIVFLISLEDWISKKMNNEKVFEIGLTFKI